MKRCLYSVPFMYFVTLMAEAAWQVSLEMERLTLAVDLFDT